MYISGRFGKRSDIKDFRVLSKARKLFRRGRGFIGTGKKLLQQHGLKNCPSFLWRSPLLDSVFLYSGGDAIHQDLLGGVKKLQLFVTRKNAPFGGGESGALANYWCSLYREHGIAGLIDDYKLLSRKTTTASERRTFSEILQYLSYLCV